jgi:hypothetical protein
MKPTFTDVAKLIAKGPPPEWLVSGLERLSGFVGGESTTAAEAKDFKQIITRMHDAADYLVKFLPLYLHMPLGRPPDHVLVALDVLPLIKDDLARVVNEPSPAGGQRPNISRKICAGAIVEAWRIVHGEPEPRSEKLWTACNEYWQACGHEYRGADIDTWRRDAEEAADGNRYEWIGDLFSALASYSRCT